MRVRRLAVWTLVLAVVLAVLTPALAAPGQAEEPGNPNPGVVPPNAKVGGLTYAQWSERWWAWIGSIDAEHHPLTDPTGASNAVNQDPSSPIYFMAGGGPEPSIQVPAGKFLFFGAGGVLATKVCSNTSEIPVCGCGSTVEQTAEYLLGCADYCMNTWMGPTRYVTVDGREIRDITTRYRVKSSPFDPMLEVPLAEDSCMYVCNSEWAEAMGGTFAGEIVEGVSDGYWIMLTPLTPGEHVVWVGFTPEDPEPIIYHLTVLPETEQ